MKTYLWLLLPLFANRLSAQCSLDQSTTTLSSKIQNIVNQSISASDSNTVMPSVEKRITIAAQKIHFWRLNWDNDFWIPTQKTDRYYTNGIFLEHFFAKNGFNQPFWKFIFPKIDANADNYYGVQLQTEMYTPDSVWTQQKNDRPYCGVATVGMTCISKQPKTGIRFTTEYRIGMIGPITQQGVLQKKWHQILHRPIPIGWNTQIPNTFVLNAHLMYEQPFNDFSDGIEMIGLADMNVGTMATNVGAGFRLNAGRFRKAKQDGIALLDVKMSENFQHYVCLQSFIHFVLANATVQGGISLRDAARKPYIQVDQLTRIVPEIMVAYHFDYGNWGFEYRFQTKRSEWKGAKDTFWGSFNLQRCF
jgi:hypothetical protein